MQKQKLNRKTAPPGFLTAKEAMHEIGVPSTSFYGLVEAGTIPSVKLPGRSEAVYPLEGIERYRRDLRKALSAYKDPNAYEFSLALKEDIPEIRDMVAQEAGSYDLVIPQMVMEGWIRRNPEAIHILRKGNELIGYVSMFPLPIETVMKRLSGEYWNRTLPIDDVQPFLPRTASPLYVAEMVAKPVQIPQQEDGQEAKHSIGTKRVGMRLVVEVAKLLLEWSKQGITFDDMYAVGTTPEGIRLCESLGMEALEMPGKTSTRVPFKLDIAKHPQLLRLADFRTSAA